MDSNELWNDLHLEELLRRPELIQPKRNLHSLTHNPSQKCLMHERKWQKPPYAVLKDRYKSVPHQPTFYNPKSLDRLADPLRGKYRKSYDQLSANPQILKDDSHDILSKFPMYDRKILEKLSGYTTGLTSGVFLTNHENEHESASHSSSLFDEESDERVEKELTSSKFKRRLVDATRYSIERNPALYKQKSSKTTRKINTEKKLRNQYINPASVVKLDQVKSSGYGPVKGKTKVSTKSQPELSWKQQYQQQLKLKHTETSATKHGAISQPIESYVKGGFIAKQREKISMYSGITESVLTKKDPLLPQKRHDIVRDRSHPMSSNFGTRKERMNKVTSQSIGTKSAPTLSSRPFDTTTSKGKDKVVSDRSNYAKTRSKPVTDTNTISFSKFSAPSSSSAVKKVAIAAPTRTTQEVMETLKKIESNELNRYDELESKQLTSQLAKYAERIDGHLNIAQFHSKSYKNLNSDEDIFARKIEPSDTSSDMKDLLPRNNSKTTSNDDRETILGLHGADPSLDTHLDITNRAESDSNAVNVTVDINDDVVNTGKALNIVENISATSINYPDIVVDSSMSEDVPMAAVAKESKAASRPNTASKDAPSPSKYPSVTNYKAVTAEKEDYTSNITIDSIDSTTSDVDTVSLLQSIMRDVGETDNKISTIAAQDLKPSSESKKQSEQEDNYDDEYGEDFED